MENIMKSLFVIMVIQFLTLPVYAFYEECPAYIKTPGSIALEEILTENTSQFSLGECEVELKRTLLCHKGRDDIHAVWYELSATPFGGNQKHDISIYYYPESGFAVFEGYSSLDIDEDGIKYRRQGGDDIRYKRKLTFHIDSEKKIIEIKGKMKNRKEWSPFYKKRNQIHCE